MDVLKALQTRKSIENAILQDAKWLLHPNFQTADAHGAPDLVQHETLFVIAEKRRLLSEILVVVTAAAWQMCCGNS